MRLLPTFPRRLPLGFLRNRERGVSRRGRRTGARTGLEFQQLESRIALAYTVNAVQLTTESGNPTFAYVIAIDDNVDANGNGRNLFMQASSDGSNYFLIDTSPSFANPQRLPWNVSGRVFGRNSTVLVTSSNSEFDLYGAPGNDLPAGRGPTSGAFAQSFTFQSSSLIPAQRLIVDLSPAGSRISIESPWNPNDGDIAGTTPGVDLDWAKYRAYGGYLTRGQAALFASEINVSSNMNVLSRFTADGSTDLFSARLSDFTEPVRTVTIGAAVTSVDTRINVVGNAAADPPAPGLLRVSTAGSLSSNTLNVQSDGADIRFEGSVSAATQSFFLNAMPGLVPDPNAYVFTTRSQATGLQSGTLSGNGRTSITTGNPSGGLVDLRTDLTTLVFQSGLGTDGQPYRYSINVEETDALRVDAVGSSKGPIAIKTGGAGSLTVLGEAIQTTGDLSFTAGGQLILDGAVSSAYGNVSLRAASLTLGSAVQAGGSRNATVQTTSGGAVIDALVQAGGRVVEPVRAASRGNQPLSGVGTGTIDGIQLATGDRVLLKNQTNGRENGIWVYNSATNALVRAADADAAADLVPGLTVYAREGTQEGGWTLTNRTPPQFVGTQNQTPLTFEPTAVEQAYANVRVATTQNLPALAGHLAIDGVQLVPGDRVLVKNQTNLAQNGIYIVPVSPTAAWFRAGDAARTDQFRANSYVFVREGTQQTGSGWVLQQDSVAVGVSPVTFVQYARTTQVPGVPLVPTRWRPADVLSDVRVATTVDITIAGLQAIDGVDLVAGDRVLVKNQNEPRTNGVYVVVAGGPWTPVASNDPASPGTLLERGGTVYVREGAFNRGSSWQFNDDSMLLGSITTNAVEVTGIASTDGLVVGMVVSGIGIVADTQIAAITGNNSVRLTRGATLTDPRASLVFSSTAALTVATPVAFIPVGGEVTVTAQGAVTGRSALQGALGLVTAFGVEGGGSNRSIQVNTNVGRLTARAPGNIDIRTTPEGIREVELRSVTTTGTGTVDVLAAGTLVATSVGGAGRVGLASTFGNLVAERVTSTNGDVSLTAFNGDVTITTVRPGDTPALVQSLAGNVEVNADNGDILVNGAVLAQATGKNVTFESNAGQLSITEKTNIRAGQRLTIDTPARRPVDLAPAGTPERVFAERLKLVAPFGSDTYPAFLGRRYGFLDVQRTDAGNIDITSDNSLTIEGAQTIDGAIRFVAPKLTVDGLIRPAGLAGDITLVASAENLVINQPLQSRRDITLEAKLGRIGGTGTARTPLLEAPGRLVLRAANAATVATQVARLDAELTAPAARLDVVESDSLVIDRAVLGGTVRIEVGANGSEGNALVGSIDVGTTGTVELIAQQDIRQVTPGPSLIRAATISLDARNGGIDVRTDVDVLQAVSRQPNQTIRVSDIGVATSVEGAPPRVFDLQFVKTTDANIDIESLRTITTTKVETTGDVRIRSIGIANDAATGEVRLGSIKADGAKVTIVAAQSILELVPGDAEPDITAATVSLESQQGSVNAHIDASVVAARALTADSQILIRRTGGTGNLSIGDTVGGIQGRKVRLEVEGNLSQTQPIAADTLEVPTTGGAVTLRTPNAVGSLRITNGANEVGFVNAGSLLVESVVGGKVDLEVRSGTLGQTGTVTATTLEAKAGPGGTVQLTGPGNAVGSVTGTTVDGDFVFVNENGLTVGAAGIVAGTAAPVAGNGNIALTATTGDLVVGGSLEAIEDTISLTARNGLIRQTAGVIKANVLNWTARQTPQWLPGGLDVNVIGPNPVTPENLVIGPVSGTLTVAATSTTGNITIQNDGDIILIGPIRALGAGNTITVTSTNGRVLFQQEGVLEATAVSLSARGTSQLVVAPNVPIAAATVTAGDLDVSSAGPVILGNTQVSGAVSVVGGGSIAQSAPVTAASLSATTASGTIVLANPANAVGRFVASAAHPAGSVSFVNGGPFSTGPIAVGTGAPSDGSLSLEARQGNLTIDGQVRAPGDIVILRTPNGTIVENVPIIVPTDAESVIRDTSSGGNVAGSFIVDSSRGLANAVTLINTLPIGPVYEILVTASFVLDATVVIANAVDMRGTTSGLVISGSAAAPNGLVFGSSAGNSRLTNLAFSGFTGTAVAINSAQNMTVRGLTVTDSGTGLQLSGALAGTTVQGSTFRSIGVAMRLTGAQRATLGGSPVAQRNRIEGASQAGVVATGFCTGTRLINTTFTTSPPTRTRYNIRSSRNLRITGTIVEKPPRAARPVAGGLSPISLLGR
jgi:hypothetical protein